MKYSSEMLYDPIVFKMGIHMEKSETNDLFLFDRVQASRNSLDSSHVNATEMYRLRENISWNQFFFFFTLWRLLNDMSFQEVTLLSKGSFPLIYSYYYRRHTTPIQCCTHTHPSLTGLLMFQRRLNVKDCQLVSSSRPNPHF